ncbi:LOW QUALITY PROTEIN: hypothetical protein U0070_014887, partial [Myodes glareolus]
LTHLPQWKIPLFLLFLVIYLITNGAWSDLHICNDHELEIPMYLFLGSLAFLDTLLSSTVTPKMFLPRSYANLYELPSYHNKQTLCMSAYFVLSHVGGFILVFLHKVFLFRLTFCNSNLLYHIYCDIVPLLKIPCIDPSFSCYLFSLAEF